MPLRLLPLLVGGSYQCLQPVEARAGQVTKGADKIQSFAKTPRSVRKWCGHCGGHLFTEHPHWGLVDVYAATIPSLDFRPGVHVHYQESVLPMPDGLPKQRDVPRERGGSGELIKE